VLVLVAVGGALYTFGAVVYGVQRPNPWPRWFGFHEVFHSFTILAFVTHYVGVSLATYSLR
jgi:hemolysin III